MELLEQPSLKKNPKMEVSPQLQLYSHENALSAAAIHYALNIGSEGYHSSVGKANLAAGIRDNLDKQLGSFPIASKFQKLVQG